MTQASAILELFGHSNASLDDLFILSFSLCTFFFQSLFVQSLSSTIVQLEWVRLGWLPNNDITQNPNRKAHTFAIATVHHTSYEAVN